MVCIIPLCCSNILNHIINRQTQLHIRLFIVLAIYFVCVCFFFFWRNCPHWARASSFTRFLDHTQRHTTVGRTLLDERSVPRRDIYLTTQNTQQPDIHVHSGFRTHNLNRRAAADLRLRPRGYWDLRLFLGFQNGQLLRIEY